MAATKTAVTGTAAGNSTAAASMETDNGAAIGAGTVGAIAIAALVVSHNRDGSNGSTSTTTSTH
jgi:hypothetical protein